MKIVRPLTTKPKGVFLYSNQDCSSCGHRQRMPLSERVFNCPCCNLHISRDLNAALNIKALGLQSVGLPLDAPPFTPGE